MELAIHLYFYRQGIPWHISLVIWFGSLFAVIFYQYLLDSSTLFYIFLNYPFSHLFIISLTAHTIPSLR